MTDRNGIYVLRRKPRLNVLQSLLFRAGIVLALIGVALAGHWLDRRGLRDHADGDVSFVDVVYFTAVTVTTVGYGDIVPVTERARLFDALVVTPIRIFVWLIFLGTAYDFLMRHAWERVQTNMMRARLRNHTIVCGFGAAGEFAVQELLRHGDSPGQIVVIEPLQERVAVALELGVTAICGDARHNATLKAARIETARSVLVSTSRDDATALVVLSARQLNAKVAISASVRAQENEDLLYQAGATIVINPVSFGGHLLARSASEHQVVVYLRDLASAKGRVLLRERGATSDDIGLSLREIKSGLGLRLLRSGREIGFWEKEAESIMDDDKIIEVVTVNGEKAS